MRVGINIPNELNRRMEPLKPYINVSQICREAIEDRVESYEKARESGSATDVVQAIDQVWEEERKMRDVIDVDWWSLGCQDARSWVAAAKLGDWEYLHHRQDVISRQDRPNWEFPPPDLGGVKTFDDRMGELYSRIRQQDDSFFDWLYEVQGGIDRSSAERDYMSAWLTYTGSVWDLFRQKRRQYTEERRRGQSEARREGSPPILSENLLHELAAYDTRSSFPGSAGS